MTAEKIVIVGSGGRLGAALMREFSGKFNVTGFNHLELDLGNPGDIHAKIDKLDLDVLINCAALTNVDLCEAKRDEAFAINAQAPRVLAEICALKKAKLIHFSTDYVFDGEKHEPYLEEDAANPISVYGESKRAGEINVLAVQDRSASAKAPANGHLVLRVSWVFGPDRPSFIDGVIKRARESDFVDAIADKFSTPTYTQDIAQALPQFFDVATETDVDLASGVLHFCNSGECSWQEYAQHALDCCERFGIPLRTKTVAPIKLQDMKSFVAKRPVYSVLSNQKYATLTGDAPRSWRDALGDYIKRSYSKT